MRTDVLERVELEGVIAGPGEYDASAAELSTVADLFPGSVTADGVSMEKASFDGESLVIKCSITDYETLRGIDANPAYADAFLGAIGKQAVPPLLEHVRKATAAAAVPVEPIADDDDDVASFGAGLLAELRRLSTALTKRPPNQVFVQPAASDVHVHPASAPEVHNHVNVEAPKRGPMKASTLKNGDRVYESVETSGD